jgi:hypothetical protein
LDFSGKKRIEYRYKIRNGAVVLPDFRIGLPGRWYTEPTGFCRKIGGSGCTLEKELAAEGVFSESTGC